MRPIDLTHMGIDAHERALAAVLAPSALGDAQQARNGQQRDVRHGREPLRDGHTHAQAREGARAAGCDAYLAKPCLPDMLWWEIRALLEPLA